MNFRDALTALALGLLTVGIVQYFTTPKDTTDPVIKSGQSFKITPAEQMQQPLQKDVDFCGCAVAPQKEPEVTTTIVDTPLLSATFSTQGATITHLACKKVAGKIEDIFTIITPQTIAAHTTGAFVVALGTATPYEYNLVKHETEASFDRIVYQAESAVAQITKEFIISHTNYAIDCTVTVTPKNGTSVQPRIFFPAPDMGAKTFTDVQQGIVYTDNKSIKKMAKRELVDQAWATPSILGAEDRYFVNALFADKNNFTQRGYYHTSDNRLNVILEGPAITEKSSWTLSFYCGPKETGPLGQADNRLEELLDYGWFAPVAKLLFMLLRWLYTVLHNYGLAIIALTLILKIAMLPITFKSEHSAQKASDLRRKIQHLEQKYKHDSETLAYEKAELMRKHGVGDMIGCLPVLLQIPIFVGLNRVLSSSIEMYEASFAWIPDLSAKDPYYILPSLIGIGMLLQATTTNDPRQKTAMLIMSLVVVGVTATLSAGLSLFFAVSTLSSVFQVKIHKFIQRRFSSH